MDTISANCLEFPLILRFARDNRTMNAPKCILDREIYIATPGYQIIGPDRLSRYDVPVAAASTRSSRSTNGKPIISS